MSCFAESMMKQVVWRVPCQGLDTEKCRTNEIYLAEVCEQVACRWEHSFDKQTNIAGDECVETGVIASCTEWIEGDRVFLRAEDKASGDLNKTKEIVRVRPGIPLFGTGATMYEARFVG